MVISGRKEDTADKLIGDVQLTPKLFEVTTCIVALLFQIIATLVPVASVTITGLVESTPAEALCSGGNCQTTSEKAFIVKNEEIMNEKKYKLQTNNRDLLLEQKILKIIFFSP